MTRTKRYHHGQLRAALVDAAERIIAERGLDAVTLRSVSAVARVTHAAPYYHFRDKEELMAAVAQRGFEDLTRRMLEARGTSPRTRLLAICEAYVRFARDEPARFRVMFGRPLANKDAHPSLKEAADACFLVLVEASERASSKSKAPELALAGWCLAHGLAHLSIEGLLDGLPIPLPKGSLPKRLGTLLLENGAKRR
jgi:AcrR family transcriptional regulator